jgi:hypothetical protein
MRALLDVNVLIALLDTDHTLHARATAWYADHAKTGWASCPITQNGCVRIVSHPRYPNALPAQTIIARIREASGTPFHEFWPDDVSLLDAAVVNASRIHGPRQLTDVYLLALARRHRGRFVTFDASVPLEAVRDATKRHLVIL